MKKINLRGITEIMTEKELKNVTGGDDVNCSKTCNPGGCTGKGSCVKDPNNNTACYCKYPTPAP